MRVIIFLALALAFPLIILWSLSNPTPEMTLEMEMAVVNAGKKVSAGDNTIGEFRGLLDQLEDRTSNSRREVADLCIAAYLWRKERGHLDSLLEFVEEVESMLPPEGTNRTDLKPMLQEMLEPGL